MPLIKKTMIKGKEKNMELVHIINEFNKPSQVCSSVNDENIVSGQDRIVNQITTEGELESEVKDDGHELNILQPNQNDINEIITSSFSDLISTNVSTEQEPVFYPQNVKSSSNQPTIIPFNASQPIPFLEINHPDQSPYPYYNHNNTPQPISINHHYYYPPFPVNMNPYSIPIQNQYCMHCPHCNQNISSSMSPYPFGNNTNTNHRQFQSMNNFGSDPSRYHNNQKMNNNREEKRENRIHQIRQSSQHEDFK